MTLEQYNQIIQDMTAQINELEQNKKIFIGMNEKKLLALIEKRQKDDRKWFITNFDIIWNNCHLFVSGSAQADIVIDCFDVYTANLTGIGSPYGISKIRIDNLFSLWNMGFRYQGCPIVELVKHRHKSKLSYIKDNKLESLSGFDIDEMNFSPLLLGVLDYMAKHPLKCETFDAYKTITTIKSLLMQ